MKTLSLLLLVIFLLLSLAGCLPAETPAETQPSTFPSSDPTQPTETTVPSTLPEIPDYFDLMSFVYNGKQPFDAVTVDISSCQLDHLYYYHAKSGKVVPVCDDPVECYSYNTSSFFFVKRDQPNMLYSAPFADLTEQSVIYNSDFGPINRIFTQHIGEYPKTVMLTEGNKRGVMLVLATGETEVFIQQHYIDDSFIADLQEIDGKLTYNRVWFRGKPNQEDRFSDYYYWVDSNTVTEDPTAIG